MITKLFARAAACAAAALAFTLPALADHDRSRERDELEDRAEAVLEDLFGGSRDRERDDRGRGWDEHDDRHRGRGGIVLFEDPGFRGDRLPVNGAVPNLRRTGFNDEVSSIRVNRGAWLVCADPHYEGFCRVLTEDQSSFSHRGLNDRISSLRPLSEREAARYRHANSRGDRHGDDYGFGRGSRGGDIIVFVDPDGRGRSLRISDPIRHLHAVGFDDTISSIRVNGGTWLLCSDPDFRGHCRTIDRSIGYTREIGLNDNISSIRRIDDDRGGRDRNWNW